MQIKVLQALGLGWSVIPTKLNKQPFIKWEKYQSIRPDKSILSQWHKEHKPPAWAVITGEISGVIVLDFDGPAGTQTMGSLGLDPHVRTPSGGYHVYVEHPGHPVKTLNSKSKKELGRICPGMDVRGDGGYAIFCGRNERGQYTWLRDPEPCRATDLPPVVRSLIGLEAPTGTEGERELPTGSARTVLAETLVSRALELPGRGRNDAGFWLACQLRDHGFDYSDALDIMGDFRARVPSTNPRGEREPYTIDEALASLKQAYEKPAREPWKSTTVAHETSDVQSDDQMPEIRVRAWPDPLAEPAYYGLAGELTRKIEPHTEADPAAILLSFLVGFGNVVGRNAFFKVGFSRHHPNLFIVLVGTSAKSRKGTSQDYVLHILKAAAPDWASSRVLSGLSSGEGLIWAIRDPIEKTEPIRQNKQITGYQTVIEDEGIADKRLLVTETEFAGTLHVMKRDGSTLSAAIRNAWDGRDLNILTKNSRAKATGPHISIIGHITKNELLTDLRSTEAGNGFGNRFLWICVRRSKVLPDGGNIEEVDFQPIIERITKAIDFAKDLGMMVRDQEAEESWREVYPELSRDKPGLLDAMTARAEAQVMRLAMIYALLDCSPLIRRPHLQAALAVWKYAEDSARFIFGDSLGDPVADEILELLRRSPDGVTRWDISNHFNRNKSAAVIGKALSALLEQNLVRRTQEDSGGRKSERWFAVTAQVATPVSYEVNEEYEESAGSAEDSSYTSHSSYPDVRENDHRKEDAKDDWGEV